MQLTGQGTAKLSVQVDPASKVAIDEKDITNYAEVLEKISARLNETFKTIPPENLPERTHEMTWQALSPEKSATPFKADTLSPSPGKANKSPVSFLSGLIGGDMLKQVEEKVKEAMRIEKEKK